MPNGFRNSLDYAGIAVSINILQGVIENTVSINSASILAIQKLSIFDQVYFMFTLEGLSPKPD